MLAPVLTMASTMLLRTMSTNTFFSPAEISDPARVRITPHSASPIIMSVMSAARARSRAVNAIDLIPSTTATMPGFFVTSMCFTCPWARKSCLVDAPADFAFMGVLFTDSKFSWAIAAPPAGVWDRSWKRNKPPRPATVCR